MTIELVIFKVINNTNKLDIFYAKQIFAVDNNETLTSDITLLPIISFMGSNGHLMGVPGIKKISEQIYEGRDIKHMPGKPVERV